MTTKITDYFSPANKIFEVGPDPETEDDGRCKKRVYSADTIETHPQNEDTCPGAPRKPFSPHEIGPKRGRVIF